MKMTIGEQGSPSGESAYLPPMKPWFHSVSVPYTGCVCCLFPPSSTVFLLVLQFFPSAKTEFQFKKDRGPAWKPAKLDVASSRNIVIDLFVHSKEC